MLVIRISNQSTNFIGTLNDISHFWNVKMAHDFRKKFGNSVHSMRAQTCTAVLRIAFAVLHSGHFCMILFGKYVVFFTFWSSNVSLNCIKLLNILWFFVISTLQITFIYTSKQVPIFLDEKRRHHNFWTTFWDFDHSVSYVPASLLRVR